MIRQFEEIQQDIRKKKNVSELNPNKRNIVTEVYKLSLAKQYKEATTNKETDVQNNLIKAMGEVEKFDGKNLRLNKYDYRKGIQALEEIQKHEKIIYIYQTINNLNLTSSEEEGNNINVHNSNAEDKSILTNRCISKKK